MTRVSAPRAFLAGAIRHSSARRAVFATAAFFRGFVLAVFGFLVTIGAVPAFAITIPTVPVGDIGNPNDPATFNFWGGVGYAYNIGKFEVTVGQYTAFLNAVAATDTYALYIAPMATDPNIGITRGGVSGNYTYSKIGSANHPITFVGWGEAARFANWLHNGQPTGPQGPGTTETGAYTLNGATTPAALSTVTRNSGATWFIPSESEWYKAAYYQPAAKGGDSDGYWAYPMRTNSVPYSDQPPGNTPDNTRVGNFYADDNVANGYDDGWAVTGVHNNSPGQINLTDVGAYALSPSFYGTFDQGGNVLEWNESLSGSVRGARGGDFGDSSDWLAASARYDNGSFARPSWTGFRVASVPEPSTAVLVMIGCVLMLCWRRTNRLSTSCSRWFRASSRNTPGHSRSRHTPPTPDLDC